MTPTGPMVWEIHTTPGGGQPCVACRVLVKGNEIAAQRLYCEPAQGGCGHYHRGPCVEVCDPKDLPHDD